MTVNTLSRTRLRSEAELIDYGNPQSGHIFQDLARFEVDIWLRSAIDSSNSRRPIAKTTQLVRALEVVAPTAADVPSVPLLSIWRQSVLANVPEFTADGALAMYSWWLASGHAGSASELGDHHRGVGHRGLFRAGRRSGAIAQPDAHGGE
ncbi:hypothetical protein MTY414_67430 [Mycolicibacterium mageritense]|nr:hypothetical protein MTY414_67430 [Mycolicibacterium mageritense]